MGDLEAQARELVVEVLNLGWHGPMCESPHCLCATAKKYVTQIASWARRLLTESRAGALTHEAIDRMARAMYAVKYPKQAHFYDSAREKTREEYRKMVRAALAAEAEPGAQNRAGKEGK